MGYEIVKLESVCYSYPRNKDHVLYNINLSVKKGEFIVIIGENGSGKTTLCKCLNGIIPHSERGRFRGRVLIDSMDTRSAYLSEIAKKVGIVLEDPESQLFTTTVFNEVAFGPENLNLPVEEIKATVKWVLEAVGLKGLENRSPATLSGGQKQRLALASVLAMKPAVMVLDEPTSQLDPLGTEEFFSIIEELKGRFGMTIIMATHKTDEVLPLADRICVLHRGRILACDKPEIVFSTVDLLEKVKIPVPTCFSLSNYLKDKGGLNINSFATPEEAEGEIRVLLNHQEKY